MNTTLISQALLALFSASSFAGVISGGGGQSVVCRNSDRSIQSAQIYDLFEAKNRYGLTVKLDNSTSYITQAARAGENIDGHHGAIDEQNNEQSIKDFLKRIRFVPPETELTPVDDSTPVVLPKAPCAIEQIANYTSDDNLLVSQEIWDSLDPTNRAALVIHEMVYFLMRATPAHSGNSTKARKVVAYAFSGIDFGSLDAGVPKNSIECWSGFGEKSTQFWAYQSASDITLQFSRFLGQPVFGTTKFVVPHRDVSTLIDEKAPCWSQFGALEGIMYSSSSLLSVYNNCYLPDLGRTTSAVVDYPQNGTPVPFTCARSNTGSGLRLSIKSLRQKNIKKFY